METKVRIIDIIEQNKEGIHLREISRKLKTSIGDIIRNTRILEKEKVIKKNKDSLLVKLKLRESPRTIAYLKEINTERFLSLPEKVQDAITLFLDELDDKPLLAAVFGSYAKGNYSKSSDIDILLVFQKMDNAKDIEATAKRISMRTNTKISPVYSDYRSFRSNFLNKEHEFSKELKKRLIILVGTEIYYPLLWRAIK